MSALLSDTTLRWVLEILAKGTLLMLVAWHVTAALRRAPAAHRHLLWTTALAGLFALPVLVPLVPGVRVLPMSWRVTAAPAAAPAHESKLEPRPALEPGDAQVSPLRAGEASKTADPSSTTGPAPITARGPGAA